MTKTKIEEKEIAVLFSQKEVSELFTALLSAHGARVKQLSEPTQVNPSCKLVTEPGLYRLINKTSLPNSNKCLIVAARNVKVTENIKTLNQPLTEEKLAIALNFLFT